MAGRFDVDGSRVYAKGELCDVFNYADNKTHLAIVVFGPMKTTEDYIVRYVGEDLPHVVHQSEMRKRIFERRSK